MIRQTVSLLIAGMICVSAVFSLPNKQAFAHTFSGDESATFLTHIEGIRVQLELVQGNLASNTTLAQQHAQHAVEHLDMHLIEEIEERNERLATDLPAALEDLNSTAANSTEQEVQSKIQRINDLLGETVSVRVESNQMSNSTVWALVLANMADGVLSHYGAAYGIKTEEDHGGHGEESGNMTHDDTMTETPSGENMTHDETEGEMAMGGENTTIVSVAEYQIAQGMADKMQKLFSDQVKEMAPANSTQVVIDIEAGLEHLKQAIDSKASLVDVEVIVHSEVHPNIQSAFNLQVIPEFPLPLLIIIPAIAAIIAASRIGALRRK